MTRKTFFKYLFIVIIFILLFFQIVRLNEKIKFHKAINNRPLQTFELNVSFVNVLDVANNSDYLIVDVRELEEFNQGHVSGALNYRTADILRNSVVFNEILSYAGDKTIVFYCYEGSYLGDGVGRSGYASSFLNSRNLTSFVISEDIKSIKNLANNYPFVWSDHFKEDIFPNEKKFISKRKEIDSEYIVDVNHLNIFIEYNNEVVYGTNYTGGDMTSEEWGYLLDFIGQKSIAIICYDNPTCFYANILGVRVEKQGGIYEGYNI